MYYNAVKHYLDFEDIFNSSHTIPAMATGKHKQETYEDLKKSLEDLNIICEINEEYSLKKSNNKK